ncbi:MAG TPA: hypothetical protein DHW22_06895 [Planctomycetaceae bacterium]|nr:hypothetical protein [Planctomycetaceae bacterium]
MVGNGTTRYGIATGNLRLLQWHIWQIFHQKRPCLDRKSCGHDEVAVIEGGGVFYIFFTSR